MQLTSERSTRVLVADPVLENRRFLTETLSACGISCVEATDGVTAWNRFLSEKPDLVLATLRLPAFPALDFLARVRDISSVPFIVQVPTTEFDTAVAAVRRGAADVIPLPCDSCELPRRIRAVIGTDSAHQLHTQGALVFAGQSAAMNKVRSQLEAVATLRIPVLFRGEKGAGKDHAAYCLGQLEGVRSKDVLKVSAKDGYSRSRPLSSKVIYVDDIESHSRMDQAYWFDRVVEAEHCVPGSARRVLFSTTSDLDTLSRRDEFEPNLAKSLLRFVVAIPPLRERLEDVIPLSHSLSGRLSSRIGRSRITFSPSALTLLQRQAWPGNVSQLAAVIERLIAFAPGGLVTKSVVTSVLAEAPTSVVSLRQDALRRKREELIEILDSTGGNLAEAARRMNMSRGAVIYRAQKFGLLAKRVRTRPRVVSARSGAPGT